MSLTPPKQFFRILPFRVRRTSHATARLSFSRPAPRASFVCHTGPGRHREEIEEPQKPVRTSRAEPSPGAGQAFANLLDLSPVLSHQRSVTRTRSGREGFNNPDRITRPTGTRESDRPEGLAV